MLKKSRAVVPMVAAALCLPGVAQAHVSFHPNVIPQGAYVTVNVRVPNEITRGDISSVAIKMPDGVLSALGAPPPGWSFKAVTRKLATPVKTDDGEVSTEVTQVDFSGGHTPPGQFVNLPITFSMPASARAGSVVSFPTVQTYSDGEIVRWIDPSAQDEHPAPSVDVSKAGGADIDVTGGDAGPPAKLPTNLLGLSPSGSAAAATSSQTVLRPLIKRETSTLSIVALIIGALGLLVGGAALLQRR